MILADTSIWVGHLRSGDAALEAAIQDGLVLMHPFVVGEIALGTMSNRAGVLGLAQQPLVGADCLPR